MIEVVEHVHNVLLVLAQSGTFAGNTTISGGTVQVGNNTLSGDLPVGTLANSGVVVFNRANALTVLALATPDVATRSALLVEATMLAPRAWHAHALLGRAAGGHPHLAAACADASHERLSQAAEDATANPAQPSDIAGREMLLNGAYLVRAGREQELRDAVRELQERFGADGVSYELTGPWPPYNFAGEENES